MSFTKKWSKLQDPEFTTFRIPRKDRDWQVEEIVQLYFQPRSPKRKYLGKARIISKTATIIASITNAEAIKDGFLAGKEEMLQFMTKAHKGLKLSDSINKLTLRRL
jgi:hypothetical protein